MGMGARGGATSAGLVAGATVTSGGMTSGGGVARVAVGCIVFERDGFVLVFLFLGAVFE
jgi:hypothetical protein